MFSKPIVLVVGAGANSEFGMPTGVTLMERVADAIKFNKGGDDRLRYSLRSRFGNEATQFFRGGNELANAMRPFISMDEALHYYSHRKELVTLGKLAIAQQILDAERNSSLFLKVEPQRADLKGAANYWLSYFLAMVVSAVTMDEMENAFESVTIVDFNYDRCIEHYLYWALQNDLNLSAVTAQRSLARLKVIRPYGSLGPLEWTGAGVPFGGPVSDGPDWFGLADGLHTYTEQVHDQEVIRELKERVDRAQMILFLGFGFHPQNTSLLEATQGTNVRLFGTVKGIPLHNHKALNLRLMNAFRTPNRAQLLDLPAHQFLSQLRLAISLAAA